jgi:serine/threonine protein phosphatase PrpC
LILALIRDGTAYIAKLGDSRAYLFRKGTLETLIDDDNLAAKRLASDASIQTDARFHPSSNELTTYMGMEGVSTRAEGP